MRVAVISDIHGNRHALAKVEAAFEQDGVDAVWCLGDLVGYGARPNECCAAVQGRAELCLAGNHDLAVLGELRLEEFSRDAAASARWTRGALEPQARAYLGTLETVARIEGAELFHASPRDPVWEYVLDTTSALDALERTRAPLVLVGHSHVPLAISFAGGRLDGGVARAGTLADLAEGRWLLNPGSVGQPRDGDPRAAYLLLDLDAGAARFKRVPYPVEETQMEIRAEGLPDALAERLALGL